MTTPDYRNLMLRIEEVVAVIEGADEDAVLVHLMADEIIDRLRDDLGIYRGRLYEREFEDYVLRATFPDAQPVTREVRIPRSYPPIDLCLLLGTVYMEPNDSRIDRKLEASLGVKEFAAVEVGGGAYVLGFDVTPGHHRDDILFSLGLVRQSINRKIRHKRMEDAIRQARQIQTSILPCKAPQMPGFDVAGRSHSLESVGGDLFDYIPITDSVLGMAIADASGHGLPAALQVRDIYVGLRMGMARDLKIIRAIERLNSIIHESTLSSRFVSMFYGELESNGLFIYVNAGHPPPFHLAADGTVTYLEEGGPVLGPLPDAAYNRGFTHVRPGDTLVMYTDGLTEAPRDGDTRERDELGVERLIEVARQNRGRSAGEILDAVFERVHEWSGGTPAQDDRTVVVLTCPQESK